MKFSANWLREIIDPKISNQELIQQLTMAGLEVESINSAVAKFSKVFTAKVVDVIQHPNAERLKVCTVKYNNQLLEIVCGDPTVSTQTVGSIVALATNGASLQDGNIKIKNSKLRGIESHGMLCSRKELALTELGCGIWILPEGTPLDVDLYEYLNLEDDIIELSITPNRGDCLSLRGIAREVAVINNLKFLDLTDKINNINNQIKNPITIDINIPDNKL
ncbi:MAG: phenylalanine--tRNA ligase subunit beta, partial [Gammaproteobacteria bacterium]|nr:phenylalanine--tRNA ligase subunit beta [Gammaproteobacteria bacterium]